MIQEAIDEIPKVGHVSYLKNKQGIFVNTDAFKETSNHWMKTGKYCNELWGTPDWKDFWITEKKRIMFGHTISGVTITGEHYNYLNYCPIQKSEDLGGGIGRKVKGFPDFWDGDYNYFWIREIARNGILKNHPNLTPKERVDIYYMEPVAREKELVRLVEELNLMYDILPSKTVEGIRTDYLLGGHDVIVLKSRRKGFSFKNAAVGARNFQHMPTSYTMLMAYEKKYLYPKGIFNMTMSYINFVNEHTAFRMPSDYVRKQDHIRNSYKTYEDGVEIEKGFMSEVQAISFKDNPQAGVGKDCLDILGEEVGSWGTPGGLKDTVASMLPSVTDGDLRTGMMTLFGTANDISKGTVDFANMFENVEMYTFLPFRDIWNDPNKVEGFFFPAQLNMIGHYDSNGNSNLQTATSAEVLIRRKKELAGASATLLNKRKREFPLNSSEALSSISFNDLPVEELKQRLAYVKKHSVNTVVGTPVTFYYEDGKIHAKPVLDGSHEPIHSYLDLPENLDGCAVIYEQPSPLAQGELYKIGYDPVEQENGSSLAAIIVYKAVQFGAMTHSCIVAEYIGRFSDPDDIDLMAEMLADYYNTKIMHENMFRSTITYFRRKGRLSKLAYQPNSVISASVKSSKVDRVYGCHMSTALKADGLKYIKTWLLTPVNYLEDGRIIRVLDMINSRRLLEELINYNNKGNFDLISALIMALFMAQEERLGKVHQNLDEAGASRKAKYDKLRGLMNNNRL